MSVDELNRVHRRYIQVSNAFKAAWTFHQFVLGLRKVFADEGPREYQADFQGLYGTLKEVPQQLTEMTHPKAAELLDKVTGSLTGVQAKLLEADLDISPALLRQFFQRVKNYDEGILAQLVKFYLYSRPEGEAWPLDRLDKMDYLITKLNEELDEADGAYVVRDRERLREVAKGFWKAIGQPPVDDAEIAALCDEIDGLRREIGDVEAIDDLNQRGLVQRYRDLKHRLGGLFFEPNVLEAVVDANLAVKNKVQSLYEKEEQRIVAEYQEVFQLEREVVVEPHLREQLGELRDAVERFERQIEGSNVRLDELAKLRQRVRDLLPRLRSDTDEDTAFEVPALAAEPDVGPTEAALVPEYAWADDIYRRLIEALEGTTPSLEPKKVALDPEIFPFGLESREVVAFRRLHGDAPCESDLEELILRAAAMRSRIGDEVEEIRGILDDTAVTRDAPIFGQARTTLDWSDLLMRRLQHRVERAITQGDAENAQLLQLLRVKLMRSYAGLWLMVYR